MSSWVWPITRKPNCTTSKTFLAINNDKRQTNFVYFYYLSQSCLIGTTIFLDRGFAPINCSNAFNIFTHCYLLALVAQIIHFIVHKQINFTIHKLILSPKKTWKRSKWWNSNNLAIIDWSIQQTLHYVPMNNHFN
jgi:hypothetical protein